jgi:hypothetical protein
MTHVLGVCTGLLAASAVASSCSLTSLIPVAVQTLRIAFRLGSRVATVGHQLESITSVPQSWSTIVLGITSEVAEATLLEFNENHVRYLDEIVRKLLMHLGPLTLKSTLHQCLEFHVSHYQRVTFHAKATIRDIAAFPESPMSRDPNPGTISCASLIQTVRYREDYRR